MVEDKSRHDAYDMKSAGEETRAFRQQQQIAVHLHPSSWFDNV